MAPPLLRPVFKSVHSTALAVNDAIAERLLRDNQDGFIFPKAKHVEPIKQPDEYPQLHGLGVKEKQLISGRNGAIPVYIWEKPAAPGKPHYLLFHGQLGHWGDVGDLPLKYQEGATYQTKGPLGRAFVNEDHKRKRLDFLKALADSGAGFTAVMLRGDGKTSGKPSEQSFNEDIDVAVRHVLKTIPNNQVIVGGESLGSACAMEAAVQMTELGKPPAQVDIANPFLSIAQVGAENNRRLSDKYHLRIHFSPEYIDEHILRHHFKNDEMMKKLSPETSIHIATSRMDDTISPAHSDKLAQIAKGRGLKVKRTYFPHSTHIDWPAEPFIRDSLSFYNQNHPTMAGHAGQNGEEHWADKVGHDRDGVHTH